MESPENSEENRALVRNILKNSLIIRSRSRSRIETPENLSTIRAKLLEYSEKNRVLIWNILKISLIIFQNRVPKRNIFENSEGNIIFE